MTTIDADFTVELTAEELQLCKALSLQKQIVDLRAQAAKADQFTQAASAETSFNRLWALSVSASVTNHYRRGAVRVS